MNLIIMVLFRVQPNAHFGVSALNDYWKERNAFNDV